MKKKKVSVKKKHYVSTVSCIMCETISKEPMDLDIETELTNTLLTNLEAVLDNKKRNKQQQRRLECLKDAEIIAKSKEKWDQQLQTAS